MAYSRRFPYAPCPPVVNKTQLHMTRTQSKAAAAAAAVVKTPRPTSAPTTAPPTTSTTTEGVSTENTTSSWAGCLDTLIQPFRVQLTNPRCRLYRCRQQGLKGCHFETCDLPRGSREEFVTAGYHSIVMCEHHRPCRHRDLCKGSTFHVLAWHSNSPRDDGWVHSIIPALSSTSCECNPPMLPSYS